MEDDDVKKRVLVQWLGATFVDDEDEEAKQKAIKLINKKSNTWEALLGYTDTQWERLVNSVEVGIRIFNHLHPVTQEYIYTLPIYNTTSDFSSLVTLVNNLLHSTAFTSTFGLQKTHEEILDVFLEHNLLVRFTTSSVYNNEVDSLYQRIQKHDLLCETEFAFYDARVNADVIHINQDYYPAINLSIVEKAFIIICIVHEIQHFLRYHFNLESSSNPLVPSETESGAYWEIQNLGGIIGASKKANDNKIFCLYSQFDSNGEVKEDYLDEVFIKNVLDVANGRSLFPIETTFQLGSIEGLTKLKYGFKCIDIKDDTKGPFIAPPFVKLPIPKDKKPRYIT